MADYYKLNNDQKAPCVSVCLCPHAIIEPWENRNDTKQLIMGVVWELACMMEKGSAEPKANVKRKANERLARVTAPMRLSLSCQAHAFRKMPESLGPLETS